MTANAIPLLPEINQETDGKSSSTERATTEISDEGSTPAFEEFPGNSDSNGSEGQNLENMANAAEEDKYEEFQKKMQFPKFLQMKLEKLVENFGKL
ncbi:unnamed protein product [Allacma fusca]|uniref:Uncharacterized protein n=1 Tax=Allacma fusca TaxID=39272 RepID=A0A8J2L842_9HEXA|nr:unnamed protein product [Allacma fusca]